ncbi:MAG: class I SAM-dependent methyltransferase [Candidatus Sumerlaeaceae bacterium]|nr:class I SAM-dependent methyltransferase [Candidatus Sumerlaeaceae bacterium]
MPTQEELVTLYSSPEYAAAYAAHGDAYVLGATVPAAFIGERLARIEHLNGGRVGRILDIGAATGSFLRVARDRGWTTIGLELSVEASGVASKEHGLDVRRLTLEEAKFSDNEFDAVHLSHVFEHLRDPVGSLAEMRRILRPGGVLTMEVPAELGDLLVWIRKTFLRRSPEPYAVPTTHTFFYTTRTLQRMVAKGGFEVLFLRTPRRNKDPRSRIPFGGLAKRAVYAIEALARLGPNIEIFARKPPA